LKSDKNVEKNEAENKLKKINVKLCGKLIAVNLLYVRILA
jgi:hypothetical protein